jgi:hypothetical protein
MHDAALLATEAWTAGSLVTWALQPRRAWKLRTSGPFFNQEPSKAVLDHRPASTGRPRLVWCKLTPALGGENRHFCRLIAATGAAAELVGVG